MWIVAPSHIHGRGVHIVRFVPAGANLGLSHWHDGHDWRTTALGEFHNHSTAPNARNVRAFGRRYLVASRDLYPGEEVLVDYRLQPDMEQPERGWR